jgi:hypothetical protein
MTAKANSNRKKRIPIKNEIVKELTIKDFFRALYKSEAKIHIEYILKRLAYLLQTLAIGWLIQYIWNYCMVIWFNGDYQVNLFEAAILWICVY